MDFGQAKQSFDELERRRVAGELSEESYREQINDLRVQDAEGRTWMPQERTGVWFVWIDGAWEPGEPPTAVTEPPPPFPAPSRAEPAPPEGLVSEPAPATPAHPRPDPVAEPVSRDRGTNVFGLIWRLLLWAALWGALLYVAILENLETNGILVLVGLALVTLLVLLWQLTRTYEGVVERVRIEEETDTDDGGSTTTRKVTYAYVRTPQNKVRKVKARRGFERGDFVYKRMGDWGPVKAKE